MPYQPIAISTVTFRDISLEEALAHLRHLGVTHIDLTAIRHYCDHFDPLLVGVDGRECARVRDLLRQYGMTAISLTSYPANPLDPHLNADDWADGVDAYVRIGQCIGARTIILPPGRPMPPANRWRGTVERAKPWLREAARRISTAGMTPAIALQSGSLLRTSDEGRDLLTILGHEGAGLAVDPAHLAAMGEDPAGALRFLGGAIAYVVLRDARDDRYQLAPGAGALDYPAILAALDEVGYVGPYVLAIDDVTLSPEARGEALRRGMAYLARAAERKAA